MHRNLDLDEITRVLTTQSVLRQGFSEAEIVLLCEHGTAQHHIEGCPLMVEGEPAESLLFVVAGEVRVIAQDHQLAIVGPGGLLGESMFSSEGVRTASVITSEDTLVLGFSLDQYSQLMQTALPTALKYRAFFEGVYRDNRNKTDRFFHHDPTRYLALIAHNQMKPALVEFVKQHAKAINQFPLVATGTTGSMLYRETGLVLTRKVKSGPLGGDQAIGQLISTENIQGVLFFRDPLSAHPHHADIEALGRLCDVYQVPFATNPSTAVAVLQHLLATEADTAPATIPGFNPALVNYQQQQRQLLQAGAGACAA